MSELRAVDPRRLGAYRLTGRLGEGGQGVVYLGHTANGAQVAVKLLRAGLSADPVERRGFLAEIEAVRRVAPFCTAQLLDADLEGDRPYLVSEYVEGVSLREHVLARGPRTGGSLHRLAIGTATALGAIHRAGVVHRDFKPGNVLLSLDGPRVIDFGISRLMDSAATTGGLSIGTPAYLAPERIKGESAGPPADLYAWALTVAYTATGRHAFTAGTHQEVLARILYGRPELGPLSGRLREIVDACLAPEPGDRPDAEEVLRRLLGQDLTGDVLSTGALAAAGGTGPAAAGAGLLSGAKPLPGTGTGTDATLVWRVPGDGGGAGADHGAGTVPAQGDAAPRRGRDTLTGRRSALAALVDTSAAGGVGPATPAEPLSEPVTPPGQPPAASGGRSAGQPFSRSPAASPDRSSGSSSEGPAGRSWRVRWWRVGVLAAGLAMAGAGFAYWLHGARAPGLDGTWTGSAEHPSAGRVFPIEIRLAGERRSSMRWGADLHCSGLLRPAGRGTVFTLGDVKGEECHPGTLRMLPTGDVNRMAITVTRQGEQGVTYAGTVSRLT